MVSLKSLLGLKKNMEEAREINEGSMARLEEEKRERRELNARLEAMEYELDAITRGATAKQRGAG